MTSFRFETFYLFEEFQRSNFSNSNVAKPVSDALLQQSNYGGRSYYNTRLCYHKDKVLAITEVQFQTTSIAEIEITEGDFERFEVVEAEDKPEKDTELGLEWAVVLLLAHGPPRACLVAQYHGQEYDFKGEIFELAYTLDTVAEVAKTEWVEDLGKLHYEYIQPHWFTQEYREHTVLPGLRVPDILNISFDYNAKDPGFALSRVVVQLLELTCFLPTLPFAKSTKTLHISTLLDKKCWEMLETGRRSTLSIPNNLYECCIPDIEPTYYCKRFTRNYAIKIKVEVSDKTVKRFAETVMSVYVAKGGLGMIRKPVHSTAGHCLERKLYLEVLEAPLIPLDFDKHLLVQRQQTAVVRTDEASIAISLKEFGTGLTESKSVFKSKYDVKSHQLYLKYKLFSMADKIEEGKVYVWAQPVVCFKGRFALPTLPFEIGHVLLIFKHMLSVQDTSSSRIRLSVSKLWMPSLLPAIVVSRGMKLSHFLKLKLVFESWDPNETITLISSRIEWLYHHSGGNEEDSLTKTLRGRKYLHLCQNGNEDFIELPCKWYNCTVPKDLLATYYSNTSSRDVSVRISLEIKGKQEEIAKVLVTVPLKICDESFEVSTTGSYVPPSYALCLTRDEVKPDPRP